MISISGLIAVLFQVITIIGVNPNIPQDVKDDIIAKITVAVAQNNSEIAPVGVVSVSSPSVEKTVSASVSTTSQDSGIISSMSNANFGELVKPSNGTPYAILHVNGADRGLIRVWSENVTEQGNPRSDTKMNFSKNLDDGLKWEFERNGGRDVVITKYFYEITSRNANNAVIGVETGEFNL